MNKKGFTLIELGAVIVIIAIISAIAVVSVSSAIKKGADKQLDFIRSSVENATNNYRIYNELSELQELNIGELNNLENEGEEVYLTTLTYRRGKQCLINSNTGYVKYVNIPKTDTNGNLFNEEEYCIYFSCDNEIIINDFADDNKDYCGSLSHNGYLQGNLKLMYDGVNNTGSGHSSSTTIWKDLSNNSNDGTLNNFSYDSSSGWLEKGLELDGTNDFITSAGGTNFATYIKDKPFTYTASFKTGMIDSEQGIISNISTWGNGGFNLGYNSSQNIYLGTGTYLSSGIVPSSTTKYTVDGVYDGSNLKIYVNGELKNTKAINIVAGSSTIFVGRSVASGNYVNGSIYNIRIYDKELSKEEIIRNYKIDKIRFDY